MLNENFLKVQDIDTLLAPLSAPYKDTSILMEDTEEKRLVDYYFSSVVDSETQVLLYEILGYSMIKTSCMARGFIFKGEGRNGKSVLYKIIRALLGNEQVSHEHLEDLSGRNLNSKSTVKNLKGCTVNIAEDQKQPKFVNTSIITRLISGEPIAIEERGKDSWLLESYATLLFSVNEVIDFKVASSLYITDRLYVIEFPNTFTDENNNRIVNIAEELCKPLALQIIATRAVQAISKVLERGRFTIPSTVVEATNNYFLECNNVLEYCSLFPIKNMMTKDKYYTEYRDWAIRNNKDAVSNGVFGKRVLALGYRAERYAFGNKRHNYYVAPGFNNCESRDIYNKYLASSCVDEATEKTSTEAQLEHYDITTFSNYLWENN